jgi:amidase/aspartyl-tRNA(Asn)/glutamyl-tRNA(Gln) amidotransferase subunit A
MPLPDLSHTRRQLAAGHTSAAAEMDKSIAAAQGQACRQAFLASDFDAARAAAADPALAHRPLAGLAVSVKDLFDVAGQVSAAGSRILQDAPPAQADCPAVARLRHAGAALIGRTNMTEFAFSGIGVNPHFGTPANALDRDTPRIPGGSSSGAAVSVATGAAFVGLGSDTGGSIRIPAAFNGVVGFKNTARLVPTDGCVPLSTSLDTVCAMTRSVADALLVHEILAARQVVRSAAPLSAYRLALATPLFQDELDPVVARALERALTRLRAAGARVDEIALAPLAELPGLRASGGFAAETYAWHRRLIAEHATRYDPRVLARIRGGEGMSAADYITLLHARRDWIARMEAALAGFDAVLSPTVPIVAPTLAEVAPGEERDARFFQLNNLTLRNTSVVNMLDGCAISLPIQRPGEPGVGLMLWHGALRDDTVLNIALQVETALQDKDQTD